MSVITPLERIRRQARFERQSIGPDPILRMLETAVWAPNDGLREPWRFLFVEGGKRSSALPLHHEAPAHLVVIAKASSDLHKQAEDLAAVYCLIQNLRLLGAEQLIGVNVYVEEWMYDPALCQSLGIRANERIAAILDIGYEALQESTDELLYPGLRISEC